MTMDIASILSNLDAACDKYRLPMLDNGYIFLMATRLSLFRSNEAWALVIERFGYSPRGEAPDTEIFAVGSGICNRKQPTDFRPGWYDKYLRDSPSLEQRSAFPLDDAWQDKDDPDLVDESATDVVLRGKTISLPALDEYAIRGIELERAPLVQTFEMCRYLADIERDLVLATPEERRFNVDPTLDHILQLEEWHHPDLARGARPSGNSTFRTLAEVLVTGDVSKYVPNMPANTHWSNWDGGRL
ncbi:MAG: hypothetical protein ABIT20_12935 [Gemmatimonadaceae bacterium]